MTAGTSASGLKEVCALQNWARVVLSHVEIQKLVAVRALQVRCVVVRNPHRLVQRWLDFLEVTYVPSVAFTLPVRVACVADVALFRRRVLANFVFSEASVRALSSAGRFASILLGFQRLLKVVVAAIRRVA